MKIERGQRVLIISGRQGKGQTGSVFWKGPNKWGEGERLGVRGDDGETYWVADDCVELAKGAPPPVEPGPTFNKGDRCAFKVRGQEGTGTVFWIGQSKSGPGQRLGVRDDHGEEAVWLDARQATPLQSESPGGALPEGAQSSAPSQDMGWAPAPEDDGRPTPTSYDMPPMDDGPPLDDAYLDSLAGGEEPEEPPTDW